MDHQEGDEEEDGCEADVDGAWETDPRQLRAAYEEHAKAARELERKGNYGPALATLQLARDEAERRWREAKPPAPLSKRLEWADAKLRRAQGALTRVRLELDAFDEDTDRRRAEICDRIQEAERWYHWRKQQLDEVHDEAAECAPGRRSGASGGGGTETVRRRIRAHMLPEMQAILEVVPEGSDLHGRLALFAAGLADAEAKLGDWREDEGPTTYHMGDDDSHEAWSEGAQAEYGDEQDQQRHPMGRCQEGTTAVWKPEGAGRWTRTGAPKGGDQQPGPEGKAGSGARKPTQANGGNGTGEGKATADGSAANASCAAAGMEEDDGDATRAGKHRRRHTAAEVEQEERAASDNRRAEELRMQFEQAAAAQERSFRDGKGGFGSEAALSVAAQGFVLRVQRVQAQAGEMGVEPLAQDGRTLLELSPAELKQWVRDNFGDDGMCD